jgi:membrane-bound lytic murein transglycosylase B
MTPPLPQGAVPLPPGAVPIQAGPPPLPSGAVPIQAQAPTQAPQQDSGAESGSLYEKYGKQYGVPLDFIRRIHGIEDPRNDPRATSTAGARGLMQVMPETFHEMNVGTDITNPDQNVNAGVKYLSQMLKRYHGDQSLAAAAYNAGPGAVDAAHGIPNIAETQHYVKATAAPQQQSPQAPALPKGATPVQALAQPQENPLQQVYDAVNPAFTEAQRRWDATVHNSAEGLINIIETPNRLVHGVIQGIHEGQGLSSIGRGLHGALNPEEGTDDVNKMVNYVESQGDKFFHPWHYDSKGDVLPPSAYQDAKNPVERALHYATDNPVTNVLGAFAAQNLTDVVNYIPLLGMAKRALVQTKLATALASTASEMGHAIPGVDAAINAGKAVHAKYIDHTAKEIAKTFAARPEHDEFLTPDTKAGRASIENRNVTRINDEYGQGDRELMKTHDKALSNVEGSTGVKGGYALPEEINQRYLREAWRHGTPEMRQQAAGLGYQQIAEDAKWAEAPENLLNYKLLEDYQYLGDLNRDMSKSPAFASAGGKYGAKNMAAEMHRSGKWEGLEADQRARVEARLKMGRDFIRKRRVDQETEAFLNKFGGVKGADKVDEQVNRIIEGHARQEGYLRQSAAFFRMKPMEARAGATEHIEGMIKNLKETGTPEDLHTAISLEEKVAGVKRKTTSYNQEYWNERAAEKEAQAEEMAANRPTAESLYPAARAKHIKDVVGKLSHSMDVKWIASPLREFSRLGKQAVIAGALPHVVNLSTLAFFKGGIPALARATVYLVKGISEEQLLRQKAMGLHHEYGQDFSEIAGANTPVLKQVLQHSNAILDHTENAMRQALLDQADKRMGPSQTAMDEFLKSQEVRDAMGDPRAQNAFISFLGSLGGPFAEFAGQVFKAGKATMFSPHVGRVLAPLRLQQDIDQEPGAEGLQIPNPAETFAKLATGAGWLAPSRSGPLIQAVIGTAKNMMGRPDIRPLDEQVGDWVQNYGGPFASRIPAMFSLPYQAPGSDPGQFDIAHGLWSAITGEYWKNPDSGKADERIQKAADRASGQ